MDSLKNLTDFIETATAERKYAHNTARGLNVALRLFEPHLSDVEKQSLDAFEGNLENIANDIFTKRKGGQPTSDTLMVYKRRLHKVVADYKTYGSDPSKMAAWNPRRLAPGLKAKKEATFAKNARQTQESKVDEMGSSQPTPAQLPINFPSLAAQTGVTTFDTAGHFIDTNRSEIFLRDGLKVILALPVDLTNSEAAKLKQYIDLMALK